MLKLLICILLLLAGENAFFETVMKDSRFLVFSSVKNSATIYALALGTIVTASQIIAGTAFSSTSLVAVVLIGTVISALIACHDFFIKKSDTRYHSLTLPINTIAALLMSTSELYSPMISLFNGVAAIICVLCFCGLKESFLRFKRNKVKSIVYAVSLLLLAIAAFSGFDF